MSFQLPAPRERQTRSAARKARTQIVHEFKGRKRRLVKKTFPSGHVFHYAGPRGEERKVRADLPNGSVHFLEGRKGQERVVRQESRSGKGNVYHLAVIDGRNNWTHCELPNGAVEYFRRVKRKSKNGTFFDFAVARSHFVHPDGCVTHYEGERLYFERRVRYEVPSKSATVPEDWPHGFVLHFEGEWSQERVARKEVPEGNGTTTVWHYAGDRGEEIEVSVDWADGRKSTIDENGDIDTTEWPNGKKARYAWGGQTGSAEYGPRSLWCVNHPDGRADYFNHHDDDDSDDEDAPWHVRGDCIAKERLSETTFPNGDRHYYCPYNDNRLVCIFRKATCRELPRSRVLWYRVREWFKRRTIVLHWQEQTQVRLYGPSGTGRLADRAAFVSDFVN